MPFLRSIPKHALDLAAYLAFRLCVCLIQATSLEDCERLSKILGSLLAHRLPLRRRVVDQNLQRIFPEWNDQQIAATRQAMWNHLLLMACEVAHAPRKIRRSNWHRYFSIPQRREILMHLLDERPKILVSAHFGNFEMAGFLSGLFGIDSTTIARPLDNPYLHDYITWFRSLGGQHFLPKDGSAMEIQELLSQGGTLALLADQDAGNRGVWVDFLGHPASCHKALALFTLSNNAPMTVVHARRLDRPLRFRIELAGHADSKQGGEHLASVPALTAWYNRCMEEAIRQHPGQYWWLHRRWREPPPRLQKAIQRGAPSQSSIPKSTAA